MLTEALGFAVDVDSSPSEGVANGRTIDNGVSGRAVYRHRSVQSLRRAGSSDVWRQTVT